MIHKGLMIPRDEYDHNKLASLSGSTVLNSKHEVSVEHEFSSKGHTNAIAALGRHMGAKQSYNRRSIRRF